MQNSAGYYFDKASFTHVQAMREISPGEDIMIFVRPEGDHQNP